MNKQEFIKTLVELVKKYPGSFYNSVTIAQAILESGWGQSKLAAQANNLFGIKASSPWQGRVYNAKTKEESPGGEQYSIFDNFRMYSNWEESVKDHASFMESTESRRKIYADAIHAKTPEDQARALARTYATDSRYGTKLINLINEYNLKQYDTRGGDKPMGKLTLQQCAQQLGLKLTIEPLPLTKTFGRINRKKGIVWHQTGAPGRGQNARAMANYQRNMSKPGNYEQKSWNYQVDDHEAIQSFDHSVATWQSSDGRGPGNTAHVAIESCINVDGDYVKGIINLAKLTACICYVEDFNPYTQTKTHHDFAPDGKWCPAQILNGKEGYTLDKVRQMTNQYLQQLNGGKAPNTLNPQGLETTKVNTYQAPKLPFKELKVGDTVTLAKGFLWYDLNNKELMLSKRQSELEGTKDKIAEVKDIDDVNFSRYAYRLEKYNSWILEENLEEVKENWTKVSEEQEADSKEAKPLPDGHFNWNGKVYRIEEVN